MLRTCTCSFHPSETRAAVAECHRGALWPFEKGGGGRGKELHSSHSLLYHFPSLLMLNPLHLFYVPASSTPSDSTMSTTVFNTTQSKMNLPSQGTYRFLFMSIRNHSFMGVLSYREPLTRRFPKQPCLLFTS